MNTFMRLRSRLVTALAVTTLSLAAGGCNDLLSGITDSYRGPPPEQVGIASEEVVVRRVSAGESASILYIDRVRYVEAGDPHNINRVVKVVTTEATRDQVAALNPQPGDRVILSTTFGSITKQVGSLATPDWPGPNRYEYPIGFHYITEISRVGSE